MKTWETDEPTQGLCALLDEEGIMQNQHPEVIMATVTPNPETVATVATVINLDEAIDPQHDGGDDATIKRLAALSPLEYDKVRSEQAKALGVRPATLDAEVKAIRGAEKEAGRLPFAEIESHPDPIDPAQLLDEVSATIRQFIVLDEHQAQAAALWCALTYFIDVVEVAPLVIINAPEKACGKTQLLTVLGRMCYRPLPASNASASALFRAVELWKPTILIDEADTFFRDNAELHGMVNAGYLRDGFVLRSEAVGDSFEPRMFSVFSAKALAGIKLEKHLPDATMSRGIVFNLRRKLSGESVSRLRHADPDLFTGIASKLARFAEDYSGQVRKSRPALPDALDDRAQDNWDGMLAVASCAGDEWLAKATAAALKLSESSNEKTASAGNELLSDIQNIFETKRIDKISTADLIAALCDDEEAPWSTYNRGRPLVPRQLVKQLEAYEIKPKQIRLNSYDRMRGFELSQFADAFMRYLTPSHFICDNVTKRHEASNGGALAVTDSVTRSHIDNLSVTAQATNGAACHTVTDKTAFSGVGVNAPIDDDVMYF
jgi:putative DNA primase/helicase